MNDKIKSLLDSNYISELVPRDKDGMIFLLLFITSVSSFLMVTRKNTEIKPLRFVRNIGHYVAIN